MKNLPLDSKLNVEQIFSKNIISANIVGIFFALFLTAGFLTTLVALSIDRLTLLPPSTNWTSFVKGEMAQKIVIALREAPLPKTLANAERGVSWLLAGDLGSRVRQGEANWLYLNDELVVNKNSSANQQMRAEEIIKVRDDLSKKGIKLLVLLVPDKSRVESSHLGSLQRSSTFSNRASLWIKDLSRANVELIDFAGPLVDLKMSGVDAFLRTDSHWTEQGAEIAAKLTTRKIKQLSISPIPRQITEVTVISRAPRPGDLVRLAGVDWLPSSLQPLPESVQQTTFKVLPIDNSTSTAVDLFGNADLPNIVLIGTSFSRTSNFIPFLEHHLQAKIGNFAKDGGNFSGAAKAYFKSSSFLNTPPKLIIWEIPERVLQMPVIDENIEL
jgi:alginate O-acetyltransferase complex protein AlgJ